MLQCLQRRDPVGHKIAFFKITVALHHFYAGTDIVFRKNVLAYLLGVFGYERIGRIGDGLRGSVVLLELESTQRRIGVPEPEYIVDIGSAERIDTLRVVAHHTQPTAVAGKHAHYKMLREIGVLILVHKHIAEKLLIMVEHIRIVTQEHVGEIQQIVEIHGIGHKTAVGISRIDRIYHRPARSPVRFDYIL